MKTYYDAMRCCLRFTMDVNFHKKEYAHIKDTFEEEESLEFFARLQKDVPWQTVQWRTNRNLPRLVHRIEDFANAPEVLKELAIIAEAQFQCIVTAGWCNLYRQGSDYTPPHQDNYEKYVITYSFGSSRRFICERIDDRTRMEFELENGDVFYFSPEFDRKHKHSIPKTMKTVGPRISIVFFCTRPFTKVDSALTKTPSLAGAEGMLGICMARDGNTGKTYLCRIGDKGEVLIIAELT